MRRNIILALAAVAVALASCGSAFRSGADRLQQSFQQLPDSQRVAVYWYWMNDNISVTGVEHDLEAMKQAGITRAFIGNIWQDGEPVGPNQVLSDGWWEVLHAALKKATELDIEIGIFNCPGWSQSGGPWVQPQQAMRYLAAATASAEGNGQVQHLVLPPLPKDGRTERVLAVPDMSDSYATEIIDAHKLASADFVQELHFAEPMTLRSITFESQAYLLVDAVTEVMVDGEWKALNVTHLDRTNGSLNVGFQPMAPIIVSVPDTPTRDVRVRLTGGPRDCNVRICLSSEPRMERFAEKSLAKMFQSPLPMWGEYMWPTAQEPDGVQLVQPQQVVDLTEQVNDSVLEWQVPDGKWTILHTGLVPTGVTNAPAAPYVTGLEVDKMSREHVAAHFDAFLGEILRRIPAGDRKTFRIVVEDSYETGGQNWTDDMMPAFEKRYGYSPVPFIPVLYGQVIGSQQQSERFLWDLRRLVADRVAYDYVGGLRDVSHRHGLRTWLECYGHWGFPSEFLMYGGQSDEVAGEFWSEGSLGDIENRAASSCAHIYGKQKVWAESCTAGGPAFTRYPAVMKQRTDRFFCEGINATLLHLFIQQPDDETLPGISAWFGNEFNRKNTWFRQMDLFTDYLRRCNLMLQQGRYVADVAYFIGEDAPKMTGECTPPLPRGYSFDYVNAEVLQTARVRNGLLQLKGGMTYRVLVLPNQKTMRPEVLRQISRLVEAGLTVVGPKPEASPSMENYPACDEAVRSLADQMWATGQWGDGRVYPEGTDLQAVLDDLGLLPDCVFSVAGEQDGKTPDILFIHRTLRDRDVYFVSNQSRQTTDVLARFRLTGMEPELWDPVTGEVRSLPQYTDNGSSMSLPLRLYAHQSQLLVFRKAGKTAADKSVAEADTLNFPEPETLVTLAAPWTLRFEEGMRGPTEPLQLDTLSWLNESEDDAVRYFSGQVDYTTTLTLDAIPAGRLYLDLGRVMVMARVYVNDHAAGGVWTAPWRVNVSGLLVPGENRIRIEVVNNWQNRMVGDLRLPEDERRTWASVNPFRAESGLQKSGLRGPVRLVRE